MEILFLLLGVAYGLLIGLIPAAGATTGLITLFGVMPYFASDPYLGVIFCVAVVASSTTGDSFSGVLLGILGANSADLQQWLTDFLWHKMARQQEHCLPQ